MWTECSYIFVTKYSNADVICASHHLINPQPYYSQESRFLASANGVTAQDTLQAIGEQPTGGPTAKVVGFVTEGWQPLGIHQMDRVIG